MLVAEQIAVFERGAGKRGALALRDELRPQIASAEQLEELDP